MRALSDDERRRRIARLKLVLTDVDGVLTDGGVAYSVHGEELRQFSVRDGLAVELLRKHGIETAFVARDHAAMIVQRARKLHVKHVFLGDDDKTAALRACLEEAGVTLEEIAYIGDDVDDLEVLRHVGELGLTAATSDAAPDVRALAHYCTDRPGGHDAFREFAETLLTWRREAERAAQ